MSDKSKPENDGVEVITPADKLTVVPPAKLSVTYTPQSIAALSDEDLIELGRQQVVATTKSFARMVADASLLHLIYEDIVLRFRAQHLSGEKREGKLTLREAFDKMGWGYDNARKFHSVFTNRTKALISHDEEIEKLKIVPADTVKFSDEASGGIISKLKLPGDVEFTVVELSPAATEVTLTYEGSNGEEKITVPTRDADHVPLFEKVPQGITLIKEGQLYRFDSNEAGIVYECNGTNSFAQRKDIPSLKEIGEKKELDKRAAKAAAAAVKPNPPAPRSDPNPPTSPSGEAKGRKQRKPKAVSKKSAKTKADFVKYVAAEISDQKGQYATFEETDDLRSHVTTKSNYFATVAEAEAARDAHNAKAPKAAAAKA